MIKYELLYEELDKMDADLSDDIWLLESDIKGRKTILSILEQELAGKLLLRAEIRQFLKESGVLDSGTNDWS